MARITIEDVATRAGVSPTTVSHVFSGQRPVSEATQAHVRAIAEQLGYRANAVAKSLRTQRTSTVMIVMPDLTNPFYPVFARGVQDTLRSSEYHTLLCNTDSREEEERAFLDDALSRRLDGVVFAGFWVRPEELLVLADAGMAVVNLGSGAGPVDSVRAGDHVASLGMTGYLLAKYGPDVALIDGNERAMVSEARAAGFIDAHQAAGHTVPPQYVVSEEFTREGGQRGMRRLLDLPHPPRAVFCANDRIALGALDVARERSLSVPGDIAIASFNDISVAQFLNPPLSTIRLPSEEIGETAVELLLERAAGRELAKRINLASQIVWRRSTRDIPQAADPAK